MARHETYQAYVVGSLVKTRFSGWPLAALVIAGLLAVPIVSVLSSFLTPAGEVWRHLWRTQLVELMTNTVLLLAGVGGGTLVVGTGLAWLVVYHRFPGRAFFEWALILPLAIPAYVLGFVFLGLFDFAGPLQTFLRATFGQGFRLPNLRSYGGVTLMMTLVFYPYVYLLARAAFRGQGAATLEMARSLGRSPLRAFVMVTLPIARPALVAGVALAMMEALADFGTVATFGYRTLTEAIYRVWYGMFDRTAATQLASGLLCFALGLLLIERTSRGRARFTEIYRCGAGVTPTVLRGWRAALAIGACLAVLGPGFLLPVGQLALWTLQTLQTGQLAPAFGTLLLNTLYLAGLATGLACLMAVVLAYASRLHPSPSVRWSAQCATLGYAPPRLRHCCGGPAATGMARSYRRRCVAGSAPRTLEWPAPHWLGSWPDLCLLGTLSRRQLTDCRCESHQYPSESRRRGTIPGCQRQSRAQACAPAAHAPWPAHRAHPGFC